MDAATFDGFSTALEEPGILVVTFDRPESMNASTIGMKRDLVELLTRCERSGLTIVEVPITFTDRTLGHSKISRQEIFRAMLTVFRLAGRRS